MATVLPPDFNILKQRASQPNYELSPEDQSVFDEFFTSLGNSAPAQNQIQQQGSSPVLTKAERSQDIQGQRAYVMPEGPVVYASREPQAEPQPSAEPQPQPQTSAEPTVIAGYETAPQPAAATPTQAAVGYETPSVQPQSAPVIAQASAQMPPESTGYSSPVYKAPSIPPVVMSMLPKVQDLTREQMLESPALAGPGAGKRSIASQTNTSIPPAPESQKVVSVQEQKRQRKAEQGAATAVQPKAGAPKPLIQVTTSDAAAKPTGQATKAPAPVTSEKPQAGAATSEEPTAGTTNVQGSEYWREQIYPEKTLEEKDSRVQRAMDLSAPMEALQPKVLEQTFQTRERKPKAAPTTPAAPTGPTKPAAATGQPTSQLPPMFDQLKQSIQKQSTVSPAQYAGLGDVTYDQGSMLVEMPDGSNVPAKKSQDGWQILVDNEWSTIDKNTPLYQALNKEGSAAMAAVTPIGAVNGAPLFADPATDDDYNLGTEEIPVKRKVAVGPSMAPQFVSSSYGVNAMTPKGPGDFMQNWSDPEKRGDMINIMRQAESVFNKTSDNFGILIDDNGKPYVASFENVVDDLVERLGVDYLQKTSTTTRLQKRNFGPEGIVATKEVLKQMLDRQGNLLGLATSLAATSGNKLELDIAELTSKRAKSSGSVQQSESASGGVSGIGVDTDYVLQKLAESLTAGEAYQASNKQFSGLDPGYIPGTTDYDSVRPEDVGAALKQSHDNFMDFVATRPYVETQNPLNNFKLAYEKIARLQKSNSASDRQELANFLAAFVNQFPEITGGRSLGAKVKPYEMGVTATPERERVNIQGAGSSGQQVSKSESAPSAAKVKPKNGDLRDAENQYHSSPDKALDTYAVDAPKSMEMDRDNLVNVLAYMKDPNSPDATANAARASAALRGLQKMSDSARQKGFNAVADIVARNIQNHMNVVAQNLARLALEKDDKGASKLTTLVASNFKDGLKLVYGDALPEKLKTTEGVMGMLQSTTPGIEWVQDLSRLRQTPGVKYIAENIIGYNDPASRSNMRGDIYKQIGASTFGAPNSQFVRSIFSELGGSYQDAQSTRNFFGLIMSGTKANNVEDSVNKLLKDPQANYRKKD